MKLLGGAKKSFSTDKIILEKKTNTINELITYLTAIKPKDTLEFDTKNLLIAINGVDSSALKGYDTRLSDNDEISIIPIIHGGSRRIQFSVDQSNVEIFDILFDKKLHRDFLDEIRTNHQHLIIQAINPKFLLSVEHAKKILQFLSMQKKQRPCYQKKLKQISYSDLQLPHKYQRPLKLLEEKQILTS